PYPRPPPPHRCRVLCAAGSELATIGGSPASSQMITPAVYRAKNIRKATFAVLANDGRPITPHPPAAAESSDWHSTGRSVPRTLRTTPAHRRRHSRGARLDRAPARRQRPPRSPRTTQSGTPRPPQVSAVGARGAGP